MKITNFLIGLLSVAGLISIAPATMAGECKLPPSAAKVTVKQVGGRPVYEFTVTNNSDAPLFIIALGTGGYDALPVHGEYIPMEVRSPEGWEGTHAFPEGLGHHDHIRYLWKTRGWKAWDDTYAVKAGETLSGFTIILENPDDIILSLPYTARFRKSDCLNGTVEVYGQNGSGSYGDKAEALERNMEETLLYMKGEEAFQQGSYESSAGYLWYYVDKYGDSGKFSDYALLYLGISFDNLTKEYKATHETLLDESEEDMRKMLGSEMYEDLEREAIGRSLRMGMADINEDPAPVFQYIKRLYAEMKFIQKYGKFGRYRIQDTGWFPPDYTGDEYVRLLERHPGSRQAAGAFLRLAGINSRVDRENPVNNFSLLEYEGFSSYAALVKDCLELYRKYEIREGLDLALIRLNLLYPVAGDVDRVSDLYDVAKAYEEILEILPEGENRMDAEEILRDMRQRIKKRT